MQEKDRVYCALRSYRLRKGWSQEELARKIQVRRQAVYDMENGRYLPNTAVALRLARLFGCAVENLFQLEERESPAPLRLVGAAPENSRLLMGIVRGNLVAHPLTPSAAMPLGLGAADGLLRGARADLLAPAEVLESTLLITGCDPALELLDAHLRRTMPKARVRCIFSSSKKALGSLARGAAHAAATHFHGEDGAANVEAVKRHAPGTACRVLAFAVNEEGLMVAPGNPEGIRDVADLAGKGLTLVNREPGAALRALLDARLQKEGLGPEDLRGYDSMVRSHAEGAFHVACGTAHAALGLRVVAWSFGLDFVPLAQTRCDLALPLELAEHPAAEALYEVLQSARLRKELSGLPGYDSAVTGNEIAIVE